jgi:uncharacterized membrane protein YoaK (UPF0700 family)
MPTGYGITPTNIDWEPVESDRDGPRARDVLLVALTFASGAVDAISYFGLGKIFSAFMTGNLVFLGFGIAHIKGPCIPIIIALSAFACGSYTGLRVATKRSRESGWWPPRMSVLLVLVAVAEAGFSAVWTTTGGHPSAHLTDVLLMLFSLAMGIQTAAVRSLSVQGVFTTAGTFTLVAVTGVIAGTRSRAELPRLVGVLVGLVAGAIVGGLLFRYARIYAPVVPLVMTILVILAGRTVERRPLRGANKLVAQHDSSLITVGYRPVANGSWTRRCATRNVEGEGAEPKPHPEEFLT